MNPAQQHAPSPEELCLTALEWALTDSKAREEETWKQLATLLDRFKNLERLFTEQQLWILTSPQNLVDISPIQIALTGWPPPPALPSKFDGDWTRGQEFLNSCQTYIQLCLDLFPSDDIKITWAMSYMKFGRAVKWVAWVFKWEEDNLGYSKFLDWEEFRTEFQKDFCPAHSDVAAINRLESTVYYQKNWSLVLWWRQLACTHIWCWAESHNKE